MNLSKSVQEALLADAVKQAETAAAPYLSLAKQIAVAVEAAKVHSGKATDERKNLWGSFKSALAIGAKADHSVTNLRVGLEVACEQAGVPGGSFRGYVTTICNLYEDIQDSKLTLVEASEMSIADARKRYRKVSDAEAARNELLGAIVNWTPAEILALAQVAKAQADEDLVLEIQIAAEKHVSEAAEAAQAAKEAEEAKAAGRPQLKAA